MLEEFRIQCDEFDACVLRQAREPIRFQINTIAQDPKQSTRTILKIKHGEISEYSVENQKYGVTLLFNPEGKKVCHKYISKKPTVKSVDLTEKKKMAIDQIFDTKRDLTLRILQDELTDKIISKKIKLKFGPIKK